MLLNREQELAVTSNERCIFLIAGAGSGKTRVIVERIKRLILNGVDPNEILCITFTNKATRMKSFLSVLNKSEDMLNSWNERIWMLMVENGVVNRDKSVTFKFNGHI